jgi:hypothetical protein
LPYGPRQKTVDNGTDGGKCDGIARWLFSLFVEACDDQRYRGDYNPFQAAWKLSLLAYDAIFNKAHVGKREEIPIKNLKIIKCEKLRHAGISNERIDQPNEQLARYFAEGMRCKTYDEGHMPKMHC